MNSLSELQALIKEKYGIDETQLDPHASIRAAGMDSLALVEFVFAIEDKYGISVPENDTHIDTLAELAALVDKTLASKDHSAPAAR